MSMPLALLISLAASPVSLCEAHEESIFAGSVEDDFGLDVAVCASNDAQAPRRTITIRWSGEGGGDAVSCSAHQCEGVVEYSRYTRPGFTLLRLAWTKNGEIQRLTQSLEHDGDAVGARTSHIWAPPDVSLEKAETFPVQSDKGDLALMKLEAFLPVRPWTQPLLKPSR